MGQARQSASTKLRAKLSAAIAKSEQRAQEWHIRNVETLTRQRDLEAEIRRRVAVACADRDSHTAYLQQGIETLEQALRGARAEVTRRCSHVVEHASARWDAEVALANVKGLTADLRAENRALRRLSIVLLSSIALIGTGALFLL